MSYIPLSNYGFSPFEKLMGHAPKVLDNWSKLENTFFESKNFDKNFLEQVRRALAFNNLCQYCMAKAGPPDENPEDNRLIVALRFANKFAIDHTSIDKCEIEQIRKYFSDAEIVELISFCSFISASQRFGAVLGLQPAAVYNE